MSAATDQTDTRDALQRFKEAMLLEGKRTDGRGKWQCPAHDDNDPSLGVKHENGKVLLRCYSGGCTPEAIVAAIGLTMGDLFDQPLKREPKRSKPNGKARPQVVATYEYTSRSGELLSTKSRWEPGRDDKDKSFSWDAGNPHVLYELPLIVEAEHVHIGEGEKAADALNKMLPLGHVATCPPTTRWESSFTELLSGVTVTLWVDPDEAGIKRASKICSALMESGIKISVVQSKTTGAKDDAFDHLEAGFTIDEAVPMSPEALMGTEQEEEEPQPAPFIHVGADAYDVLRSAPEPEWLVQNFLRTGKVTVLGGSTMSGKSYLGIQVGSSIAAGYPVWPGVAGETHQGVVVFIGYDPHMTVEDVTRRLDQLDRGWHRQEQNFPARAWAEQFVTVGSSEVSGAFPADRYRLDAEGCERIADEILRPIERERGPIKLIVADTLSTALPDGVDENDNPAMTAVITRLSGLALDFHAAALTVHHPTKANSSAGKKFNSMDPNSYFRGAGAIPSAAGVLAGLWAPEDHPQSRVLTCWSNSGQRERTWFQVAEPERAALGMIDYWWPGDPPDDAHGDDDEGALMEDLARAFAGLSDRISMNKFTRESQCTGPDKSPSGNAKKKAEKLLKWAIARDLVGREENNAKRIFVTPAGTMKLSPFRTGEAA